MRVKIVDKKEQKKKRERERLHRMIQKSQTLEELKTVLIEWLNNATLR